MGIEAALREVRGEMPEGVGWRIEMRNEIPLARGLGSSAAATVAGLVAGNALLGEPLTTADLLRLATAIEGHPDNAAAALLGGFTVCARDRRRRRGAPVRRAARPARRPVHPRPAPPDRRHARRRCRAKVPLEDAVANLTRVAIGVAGMATGRFDLLRVLTVDRLHEQYRAKAFPQLPRLVAGARRRARSAPACRAPARRSSRSPTRVRTITRIEAAFGAAAADTDLAGRIEVVSPRNTGAKIV